LDDKGIQTLAGWTNMPRLTSLDLRFNAIGTGGAGTLATSLLLAKLQRLDLSCNELGDEGVRRLAESPRVAELSCLSLCDNGISDVGAVALATSNYLSPTCTLCLGEHASPAEDYDPPPRRNKISRRQKTALAERYQFVFFD
jgi:hypothetical protein